MGENSLAVKSRSVVAMMGPDGKACRATRDGEDWLYAPCVHTSFTVYDQLTETGVLPPEVKALYQSTFLRAEGQGLVSKQRGTFYNGGKFDVMLNAWRGDMVYTPAGTGPTWQLSDGQTTQSGIFTGEKATPVP
jgi:hypothetical protein